MVAYLVADIDVLDPEEYKTYVAKVPPTIAKFGGKYLARGGRVIHLEGAAQPHRVVILEFADLDTAKRWYDSPEYQEVLPIRLRASRSHAMLVEGT